MISLLFAALATPEAATLPAAPVEQSVPASAAGSEPSNSSSKRVCTTVRVTGSRLARERRCRSREEADLEARESRDAVTDAGRRQYGLN